MPQKRKVKRVKKENNSVRVFRNISIAILIFVLLVAIYLIIKNL